MELFADGWSMIDHRTDASPLPVDRDTCREWTASVFDVSPDVRFTIDEVLACDDRVIAMRASYRGSGLGPGGSGAFEFVGGFVTTVEGGHSVRVDQYEYDDDASMRARFAELTGR